MSQKLNIAFSLVLMTATAAVSAQNTPLQPQDNITCKAGTRWWWLGSAVDSVNASVEPRPATPPRYRYRRDNTNIWCAGQ